MRRKIIDKFDEHFVRAENTVAFWFSYMLDVVFFSIRTKLKGTVQQTASRLFFVSRSLQAFHHRLDGNNVGGVGGGE